MLRSITSHMGVLVYLERYFFPPFGNVPIVCVVRTRIQVP